MHFLQGFKTIIFNAVAAISSWIGVSWGIEVPEEQQTAICTTIIALANIGLRLITKTPVGKGKKGEK